MKKKKKWKKDLLKNVEKWFSEKRAKILSEKRKRER